MQLANYFSDKELNCQHCGAEGVLEEALMLLNLIRIRIGRPIRCTSGYRCPEHPIEKAKPTPGQHAVGHAFDLWTGGDNEFRDRIITEASAIGFNGIGTSSNFVHIDCRAERTSWTY